MNPVSAPAGILHVSELGLLRTKTHPPASPPVIESARSIHGTSTDTLKLLVSRLGVLAEITAVPHHRGVKLRRESEVCDAIVTCDCDRLPDPEVNASETVRDSSVAIGCWASPTVVMTMSVVSMNEIDEFPVMSMPVIGGSKWMSISRSPSISTGGLAATYSTFIVPT